MASLIRVAANDVPLEGIEIDVPLPASWLDAQLGDARVAAAGDGLVRGRLSRSGKDIVVRCRVRATVQAECVRCLGPARFDLSGDLSLLLRAVAKPGRHAERANKPGRHGRRGAGAEEEHEFTAAEADTDSYDGETVILDPFVREAILLEMPSFPLCSEQCPGMAPGPEPDEARAGGQPAAVDPRLAPLGALSKKMTAQSPAERAAPPRPATLRPILRANSHRAKKRRK